MFSYPKQTLKAVDPDLWAIVQQEHLRQGQHIELVGSENYASPAVMAAQGSQLTNRYAEGYPGRRDHGGCEYVDMAEQLAMDRLCTLFGADRHGWRANVQPHSGAQANAAACLALLQPGDTLLGLNLNEGDTGAHGMPLSQRAIRVLSLGPNAQEVLDYDEIERVAQARRPRVIGAFAATYAQRFDFARLAHIAHSVGAWLMVDMGHQAGPIAAGELPSPLPHADVVTGNTHQSLRGPRGGFILSQPELAAAIDRAVFPGTQGAPMMHLIAAKAVAFKEALEPEFRRYQRQAIKNASALAQTLVERGLRIVGGRTDSHLMVVDVRPKGLDARDVEALLGQAHITIHQQALPHEQATDGVRHGVGLATSGITTRGFKEADTRLLGHAIADVLDRPHDATVVDVRARVAMLARDFPIYA